MTSQSATDEPLGGTHPLLEHLHLPPVAVGAGTGRLEFEVEAIHLRRGGVLHGGLLATVLDAVTGATAFHVSPPGTEFVTIQLGLNMTATAKLGDRVVATAKVEHAGRRTMVLQADIRRGDGKLLAAGSVTLLVIHEGLRA